MNIIINNMDTHNTHIYQVGAILLNDIYLYHAALGNWKMIYIKKLLLCLTYIKLNKDL